MKTCNGTPRRRALRRDAVRRAQLLAAFARSGLSATAFARQHGIHYTTFCSWRYQGARTKGLPGFVQVELPEPTPAVELMVELGGTTRLLLTSEAQIPLAARLLQAFNISRSC
jgi:transposase-like protein